MVWAKFNIQAQYSEARLGIMWVFLQPVITAIVFTVAFNYLLGARPPSGGAPFLCFYLSGITPWQIFNDNVMRSGHVVVSNIGLMTQIRFPREASVFVSFFERLVDFFASFLVTVLVLILYGIYPNIYYLYLPWIILILAFFTLGIMFVLSAVGVFFRDLPQIISPVMRLLFFLSGVIFSLDNVDATVQKILRLNPIVWIIEAVREIMLYRESPNVIALVVLFGLSVSIFIIGYGFFKSKEAVFTDYL